MCEYYHRAGLREIRYMRSDKVWYKVRYQVICTLPYFPTFTRDFGWSRLVFRVCSLGSPACHGGICWPLGWHKWRTKIIDPSTGELWDLISGWDNQRKYFCDTYDGDIPTVAGRSSSMRKGYRFSLGYCLSKPAPRETGEKVCIVVLRRSFPLTHVLGGFSVRTSNNTVGNFGDSARTCWTEFVPISERKRKGERWMIDWWRAHAAFKWSVGSLWENS